MNSNAKKILEIPPRTDIRWKDFLSGMESLGFYKYRNTSSHYFFKHTKANGVVQIAMPHGSNNCVLHPYIKKVRVFLEDNNLLEEDNNE